MTRERSRVFGEVAELYDATRPSYPDAVFDAIVAFGSLAAGDRAVEVGAGTGKATRKMVARGLDVLALEPDPEMGRLLRPLGVEVVQATFEDWNGAPAAFRCCYAAQSWHWVTDAGRYAKARDVLEPGGVLALLWNKPREFTGALGHDLDAAYDEHAPALRGGVPSRWDLDATLGEIAATPGFAPAVKREFAWVQPYTTAEYVALQETHSDHRMLAEWRRTRLHAAVGEVVDRHGGTVAVEYDAVCYLALRG